MSVNLTLLIYCNWGTVMHARETWRLQRLQQIHDKGCLMPVPCYLEAAFIGKIPF